MAKVAKATTVHLPLLPSLIKIQSPSRFVACAFSSFFSTDTISKLAKGIRVESSKKAVLIKRLHKENKEMFGELLESKVEKVKRIKSVEKLVKKGKKKKAESPSVLTLDTTETESNFNDVDPFDTPIKRKTQLTPDHDCNILRNNENTKDNLKAEINWTMKTHPQRTKIITRFKPEVILQAFDSAIKSNVQFQVPEPESVKEMSQVPTIKQYLASLELDDYMRPSSQSKVIKQDPSQTTETETDNRVETLPEEDIAFYEKNTENLNAVQNSLPEDLREPKISNNVSQSNFDNPTRKIASLISSSPPEIISLPYEFNSSSISPRLPSVSKILQATMSPEQVAILEKWQQKMIEQLGEEGFKKYKDALFYNGKELHKNIQSILSGTPREFLTIEDSIFGHWNSLQSILPAIENVLLLESFVAHPTLGYCGIVDCVASYRDKLVLIDWKTSEKRKSFVSMTYDTPLQISAYIGALNHDPKYSFKITEGLIVIAYQDGSNCQIFHLNSNDIKKYWNQWLARLNLFKKKGQNSTVQLE